jgi:hypothetical protein
MAAQPRRKVTWQTVKKNDIKLSAVIEEYLHHYGGRNHSPKTVRWYADILAALNVFLGRRDGFDRVWPPQGRYEDSNLEDVANRVRRACAAAAS